MINKDRNLIKKLMTKAITKEEFLNDFNVDSAQIQGNIKELLEIAYNEKNADDVEFLLFVGFTFNLFSGNYINILCKLL